MGPWMTPAAAGVATARSVRVRQWLMLLVALAGLLAMHGFSDHGVAGAVDVSRHAMTHDASAAAADVEHAGDHAASMTVSATAGSESALRSVESPGEGHGGHGGLAAVACLAVLMGMLVLLVARWPARVRAWLQDALHDLSRAAAGALRARSREPRPPDLRSLSIQRC